MNWSAEIYEGALPLTVIDNVSWTSVDENTVQRVRVSHNGYTMIMQGHDFYWVDEDSGEFGCFNGPHNQGIYEGSMSASFKATDDSFESTGGVLPGDGISILGSCYMPEQEAKQVGIL